MQKVFISVATSQSFGWDLKPRSNLVTHAIDLVGIKRSWHSIKGGSVIVGVERVSVTNRYPTCKRKCRGIKEGKKNAI